MKWPGFMIRMKDERLMKRLETKTRKTTAKTGGSCEDIRKAEEEDHS